jgi:hypothetical protein
MKKSLPVILLIVTLLTIDVTAQTATEDYRDHYTTKVIGQFIAFDANMGAQNTCAGYGFQLDGFIGKRFSAALVYSTNGWWDYNADHANDPDPSITDPYQGIDVDQGGYLQINARFHLSDKMGMGKIKWERMGNHTNKVSDPTKTYSTVYTSKGMVRKIKAVRGGLYNWKSAVKPESGDEWYVVPSGSTTQVLATEYSYTTLRSQNLYAGLTTGKLVDADRMGRHISYLRWWFADVLINSSMSMDDIKYKNGSTAVFQIGEGTLNKETIGWRVGFEWIALARKYIIMGVRMEGGKRPAVTDREPYFQVTLGLGSKYATKPTEQK